MAEHGLMCMRACPHVTSLISAKASPAAESPGVHAGVAEAAAGQPGRHHHTARCGGGAVNGPRAARAPARSAPARCALRQLLSLGSPCIVLRAPLSEPTVCSLTVGACQAAASHVNISCCGVAAACGEAADSRRSRWSRAHAFWESPLCVAAERLAWRAGLPDAEPLKHAADRQLTDIDQIRTGVCLVSDP